MANGPNLDPGPRNSAASSPDGFGGPSEHAHAHREARSSEPDVAELAAKFAEHSRGTFSLEFSVDLALEIVLNEIVEQACLATSATGAAIVLRRGAEMVCRASSGASAPNLGARMEATSGLSGLCLQTGQIQRCDDAQTDPRADIEASQRLGVRSVMVLPLSRPTGVLGIFEVFSTRPSAFGERDERTLEALARRVLRNVERAAEPFVPPTEAPIAVRSHEVRSHEVRSDEVRSGEEIPALTAGIDPQLTVPTFAEVTATAGGRRGSDLLTRLLGLIVLAGVVLLGGLISRRLGWDLATSSARAAKVSSRTVASRQNANAPASSAPDSGTHAAPAVPGSVGDPPATGATQTPGVAPTTPAGAPAGSLLVFENGREVFRMPPSHELLEREVLESEVGENDPRAEDQRQRIVELSPGAAEGSVIHRVEPEYPEQARLRQRQGKVLLKVRIHPDGVVEEVELVSGDPLLAQAAIDAVKQWRFRPQTGKGDFAEMQTQVTLNFRLPQ